MYRGKYRVVLEEMDSLGILRSNEDRTGYTLSHKTVEYFKSLERRTTPTDIIHLVMDVYKIKDQGAVVEYASVIYNLIQLFEERTGNIGVMVERLEDV